ncbi:iron-containing alcohol dehydrogenase [Thiomicrorhabdus sediminis]|uniref:Iron-containing alcohol dehydrogenase n=1 Tax=Thiomicrorhabdus sediminis TaxID=2580412 RepID=A0A4P9K531_9GAMM|nr:iron-containing alcohol dehydrogenase [Thiomicrorhabdus sediminis]QCU89336.1 iron-containing alcohol dehydrogenase [Thiomicrorhabdus sediminis]
MPIETLTNSQPVAAFQFASTPEIHFGWGVRQKLLEQLQQQRHTNPVLIVSPSQLKDNRFGLALQQALQDMPLQTFSVSGEPSPDLVDEIVAQCHRTTSIVIGLGGGSVLDTAKAVAGLIPSQTSVMDYLEGVGKGKAFRVETTDFIAIPTTAGTGSETTKNAVLSRLGEFKKSFRDNKLLAKQAWLDPELLTTCPQDILYATGMDAFTQLLESYTTLKPNPITDALAWQGMQLFRTAFDDIDSNDSNLMQRGYGNLMLAACLSGLTLANAGLGAVHGLAGPIGAFFKAPHGIVCARLLAPITRANIHALVQKNDNHSLRVLDKYRDVALLLCPHSDSQDSLTQLINYLTKLADDYAPSGLQDFGLTAANIEPVIENCRSGSMLGNPLVLDDMALRQALLEAIG